MNIDAAAGSISGVLQQPTAQAMLNASDDWLLPKRKLAAGELLEMPLPERKQEAWRYTSTAFFEEQSFQLAPREPFRALEISDIEDLLVAEDTYRMVFVNGHFAPQLSDRLPQMQGLGIETLANGAGTVDASVREQLASIAPHRHVFEAMNTALASDGVLLHLAAGTQLDKPLELLHVTVGAEEPTLLHPRHLIVAEAGAKAQVIERYCPLGESRYFTNALIEVSLAEGAQLQHQRLQEESSEAQHISDLHVRQQAKSDYRLVQASLGGAWSRSDVRLELLGEQARAEVDGLLIASDRQLNDMHLEVRHVAPGCSSRESVKGILDGKGRIVFDGHIHVAREGQKTDAVLSNDNLMLSRSAEVDTKPQLEIFADDVKCSHGTTVGELDQNMLFYLRSRGIGPIQAQRMLCQGFAQQPIDAIQDEALRERVSRQLAARLGGN